MDKLFKSLVCKIYRELLAEYGKNGILYVLLVYNHLKIRIVAFSLPYIELLIST